MVKYMFPNGKYTYFSDRQFMILVDGGVEYTFKEELRKHPEDETLKESYAVFLKNLEKVKNRQENHTLETKETLIKSSAEVAPSDF